MYKRQELDSAAFVDIYGRASHAVKQGFTVRSTDDFSTIALNILGADAKHLVVQLLDGSDNVVKQVRTSNATARFFYVEPREYYVRLFVDRNDNGQWDTGNYDEDVQPEEVYYYPKKIECRAKWDFNEIWNLNAVPVYEQKPAKITKQKAEQQRKIKSRNAKRALDLGIKYLPDMLK